MDKDNLCFAISWIESEIEFLSKQVFYQERDLNHVSSNIVSYQQRNLLSLALVRCFAPPSSGVVAAAAATQEYRRVEGREKKKEMLVEQEKRQPGKQLERNGH